MRALALLLIPSLALGQKYTDANGKLRVALAKQPFSPNGTVVGPYTMANGGIQSAKLSAAPRLTSLDQLRDAVELAVVIGAREYRLRGQPFNQMLNSFTEDFDFYHGVAPALAEFMSIDQPMQFDSETGVVKGYVQRSMRISASKGVYA